MRVPNFPDNKQDLQDSARSFRTGAKKKSKLDLLRKKIRMIILIKGAYSQDPKLKIRPMDKDE